jgi:hypothetical protein
VEFAGEAAMLDILFTIGTIISAAGFVYDAYPVIRYAFSPEHTATTATADDEVPEIWYYLNW